MKKTILFIFEKKLINLKNTYILSNVNSTLKFYMVSHDESIKAIRFIQINHFRIRIPDIYTYFIIFKKKLFSAL